MRLMEFFLSTFMRQGNNLRALLKHLEALQAHTEAHTEALQLRHDLLAMLATAQQPPEAEGS